MPSYQPKETKRLRMSEEWDEDIGMADAAPSIKKPPSKPLGTYKKASSLVNGSLWDMTLTTATQEVPAKPVNPTGPSQSASRDLLKTAQHNSHMKAANPLDMAQVSNGKILFAPNPHASGSQPHKTPIRPPGTAVPKSSAKTARGASPRTLGDAIDLPEIDSDDEDNSDADDFVAPWADSPALRAALVAQEPMDPEQIFGPPKPLNMEEVFSKSKDRWGKFRARTSSANWSGSDRLTEEEIRKDRLARERMRREGGWSYDLGRDMA
jgi:hypothetical protein